MKKLILLLIWMTASILPIMADDTVREGQSVVLTEDCYGTVVPETLDKLVEYSRNDNFDMLIFFGFCPQKAFISLRSFSSFRSGFSLHLSQL